MGILAFLVPLAVQFAETVIKGKKMGATKKDMALSMITVAQQKLAGSGQATAIVPDEEVSKEIDDVVAAMNKLGTMPMGSAGQVQQGLFTGLEVLQLINAFSLAVANAQNPHPVALPR